MWHIHPCWYYRTCTEHGHPWLQCWTSISCCRHDLLRSIIECKLIIHHSLISHSPPVLQHVSPVPSVKLEAEIALVEHPQKKLKAGGQSLLTNYFLKHFKRELKPLQETPPPNKARIMDSPQFFRTLPKEKHKLANNYIITKRDRLRSDIFPKPKTNTLCTH